MRVACVGGGPAGLYFALLVKLRESGQQITVFERSAPGATRSWGVVFWGDLLEKLYSADAESAREIERASFPWDRYVVDVQGKQAACTAKRGYGISRQRLLGILADRALALGVQIEYEHGISASSATHEALTWVIREIRAARRG
jgi:anthraniloyl-CoA monooxygenase